ncbi:MAG: hypothetical protein A2138_23820 [Deltaproteobacteria bacterium RBG_16_71_12]|nr:MAG: hypothetical protein A2138_23820 [Deltaproteobacteria bacterium RBG_16_71_12]
MERRESNAVRCVFRSHDESTRRECAARGGLGRHADHGGEEKPDPSAGPQSDSSSWCELTYYARGARLPSDYEECVLANVGTTLGSVAPSVPACFVEVGLRGAHDPVAARTLFDACRARSDAREEHERCVITMKPGKLEVPATFTACRLAGGAVDTIPIDGEVCVITFGRPQVGVDNASSPWTNEAAFERCWTDGGFATSTDRLQMCSLTFKKAGGELMRNPVSLGPVPPPLAEIVTIHDVNIQEGSEHRRGDFVMVVASAGGGTIDDDAIATRLEPSGRRYVGSRFQLEEDNDARAVRMTITATGKSGVRAQLVRTFRMASGDAIHEGPPRGSENTSNPGADASTFHPELPLRERLAQCVGVDSWSFRDDELVVRLTGGVRGSVVAEASAVTATLGVLFAEKKASVQLEKGKSVEERFGLTRVRDGEPGVFRLTVGCPPIGKVYFTTEPIPPFASKNVDAVKLLWRPLPPRTPAPPR